MLCLGHSKYFPDVLLETGEQILLHIRERKLNHTCWKTMWWFIRGDCGKQTSSKMKLKMVEAHGVSYIILYPPYYRLANFRLV